MKTIVLNLILLLVSNALADGNWRLVHQPAESVIQDFKDLAKCEARIWPGFSLKGFVIVIIDPKKPEQQAIDYDTGTRFKVRLSDLPPGARSQFHVFERGGKHWLSLAEAYNKIDSSPHSIFRFGVHEAFHYLAQAGWSWGAANRGEQIPISGRPRFYRAMLNQNLKAAYLDPQSREVSLGRARFWYDKWRSEFPGEVEASVDSQEGSARYSEIIAYALIQKGCSASEPALREATLAIVKEMPDLVAGFGITELDSEAYVIAALAELILRFDANVPDWQAKHLKGKASAIDILLENVRAIEEPGNADDLQSFSDIAELKQEQADGLLGLVRERMRFRDSYYLNLPADWKPGATEYTTFYYDTQTKNRFSVFFKPEKFQASGSGSLESLDGMVSVEMQTSAPCRKRGWAIPVLNQEAIQEGNLFKIDAEQIKGSVGAALRESGGLRWLCIGE